MQFRNSPSRYGVVTKTLHWVIGLGIIVMLAMGIWMEYMPIKWRLSVMPVHKSIGITILALAAIRVIWHLISKKPPFVDGIKKWEAAMAHAVHGLLYLSMFGMPLSGWLMSSAAGRSVEFFGLFTLPDLVVVDQELRGTFGTIHTYLGYTLIITVALHAAGALKHHFISKDATLRRMLPLG